MSITKQDFITVANTFRLKIYNMDFVLQSIPTVEYVKIWLQQLTPANKQLLINTYFIASGVWETIDHIMEIPFFNNILPYDDYSYNYLLFILASQLYPPYPSSGLSPEQIVTSPFIYLTHGTHLESLATILDSGYILPGHYFVEEQRLRDNINEYLVEDNIIPKINIRLDQYPGVFLYPNINDQKDLYTNFGLEVIFVLSLSLLTKRGWHISRDENYGSISSLTWDYKTLPQHLMFDYIYPNTFGELVMHYPIPLEYVECIVATEHVERVRSIVDDRFVVYTLDEFKRLPKTKYVKHLYTNGTYDNGEPNFCYDNLGGDKEVVLSNRNIQNTLLNCGYGDTEVQRLMEEKSYSQLLSTIQHAWTTNLLTRNYPKPHSHPPY